ncbi:MAG: hypothetical protein LBG13_01715 [Holosporales bacterium]|nr:hypothetical protein [Holosporales bacterium]
MLVAFATSEHYGDGDEDASNDVAFPGNISDDRLLNCNALNDLAFHENVYHTAFHLAASPSACAAQTAACDAAHAACGAVRTAYHAIHNDDTVDDDAETALQTDADDGARSLHQQLQAKQSTK